MNSSELFRPAVRDDARRIAELFVIASGGVVEYVWSTLSAEYPGLGPFEIGTRRYAREEGTFSYRNCTMAELDGEVVGMLHAYTMPDASEQEDEPGETVDPVLEPYARLEIPGSYYVSGLAFFPEHRGRGLGTRMLGIAAEQARQRGCREMSLLVFEQNDGAVRLYERNGFRIVGRAPVTPHESIRYVGEVLLMTTSV